MRKIVKTVFRAGGLIGGGAVVGCLLRNADLSGLKGIGKICAGLGIIGLSHAAGNAAADALEKDVEAVYQVVDDLSSIDLNSNESTENNDDNVVEFEFAAT